MGIAVLVAVIWAASNVADAFLTDYNPSPSIGVCMMLVVGGIFGVEALRKWR